MGLFCPHKEQEPALSRQNRLQVRAVMAKNVKH